MNLDVINSVDGTVQTAADLDEILITLPVNSLFQNGERLVLLRSDTAISGLTDDQIGNKDLYWTNTGDLTVVLSGSWIVDGSDYTPECYVTFNFTETEIGAIPRGTYRNAIRFTHPVTNVSFIVRLTIKIVDLATFSVRPDWLAPELIDLEFDLETGTVRSGNLSERASVLAAASEPTFAVLPRLAGVILDDDVTELSLVIRRKNQFDEDQLVAFAGTDADIVTVMANSYYALAGMLMTGPIADAFDDLNQEAIDLQNPDRVQKLLCLAQLRVKYNGAEYLSAPFALALWQPCDETLLEV